MVSVPALALVPVAPLAVESAEFKFRMMVKKIERHRQMQASEAKAVETEKEKGFDRQKRPWFLVVDGGEDHTIRDMELGRADIRGIVAYIGDNAIYTTMDEKSRFFRLRQQILAEPRPSLSRSLTMIMTA